MQIIKYIPILMATFIYPFRISGQPPYVENETHILWHPDRPLTAQDYKGTMPETPLHIKARDELQVYTVASIEIGSVLDLPTKKSQRNGVYHEKIYFAPLFEKNSSYMVNRIPSDTCST